MDAVDSVIDPFFLPKQSADLPNSSDSNSEVIMEEFVNSDNLIIIWRGKFRILRLINDIMGAGNE